MTGHHRPAPDDHAGCQLAREEAAVDLLTGSEPSRALRAHLEVCPPCQAEYRRLAELTPLLAVARDAQPSPPPERPSPLLLDRLLIEVGRRNRQRRRIAVGLAVAAAAVVVAVPALRLPGQGEHALPPASSTAASTPGGTSPSSAPGTPTDTDGTDTADTTGATPSGVVAEGSADTRLAMIRVWVRPQGSGSSVTVALWLRAAVPPGRRCQMVVHAASGTATSAGSWSMDTSQAWYTEDIGTSPAQIRRIEFVEVGTGERLADVPVRST